MKYKLTRDFLGFKKGQIVIGDELEKMFEPIKETKELPRWTKDGMWIEIKKGEEFETIGVQGLELIKANKYNVQDINCGNLKAYKTGYGEKAMKKQQAEFAIKKRIVENDNEWEIDWNDKEQEKWNIEYYYHDAIYYIDYTTFYKTANNYYFSSEDKAQECLSDCKQHLDILFDVS